MNPESQTSPDNAVQFRLLPYPYRAMLAICSDLDETADKNVYFEIMRFLNTTQETSMGTGVGLEVGNSIYFDMPSDQFSYWNTDDSGREMVRSLIKSGHIDCLHSYGDLAATRKDVERALEELNKHDCKLEVWIDHGTAVTNFDSDIMQGHGDQAGHQAYHADLTTKYGIKYIWCGRVTSVTGQDVRAGLREIFNCEAPIKSSVTLFKEAVKQKLAKHGNIKYAMHSPNKTLRQISLCDGSQVYEFMRCNPHWGGVSSCDQGRHIGEVLTEDILSLLVKRGGSCVLYTHLGKIDNRYIPFNEKAVSAFRRLAKEFCAGRILVTTTRRLLGYQRAYGEIIYNCKKNEKGLCISIDTQSVKPSIGALPKEDFCGLTFYVSDPENTYVTIDGHEVEGLDRNEPDYTGKPSVSLPWTLLEFPKYEQ